MKIGFAIFAFLACTSVAAQVTVGAAWARPTLPGQQVGGGYLTLRSDRADRLLGGSTPWAERVELHVMSMRGDVMSMRQLAAIELPAGQAVDLAPGGRHMMLVGLKGALKVGDKVPLILRFEQAGEVRVEMTVARHAPAVGGPQR